MTRRQAYYAILEHTQRHGLAITEWLDWFLATLEAAIRDALDQVRHLLLKAQFWRHHDRAALNTRETKLLNRLLDAGPDGFEGGLNARKYMGMVPVSKATATRDLTDLLAKGCLQRRPGGGRSTSYDLRWPAESVAGAPDDPGR